MNSTLMSQQLAQADRLTAALARVPVTKRDDLVRAFESMMIGAELGYAMAASAQHTKEAR